MPEDSSAKPRRHAKATVEDVGLEDFSSAAARLDLPPGTHVGRYLVLQRIGAGGMGVVYAAFDPELDRKIALKLLQPDALEGERASRGHARLIREAQAMAKLSHPNVVAVHDVGAFGSRVFVAMEFVAGATLSAWATETRPWREVVDMYRDAGEGLAAAHARGLVHRDFKPDNVLVGEDGRPRVLDFGLARRPSDARMDLDDNDPAAQLQAILPEGSGPIQLSSSLASLSGGGDDDGRLTKTGTLAGTPAYMAPEQYRGMEIDARTDQFSFCVALWEALYGQRPFTGASRPALAMAVCNGEIVAPPSGREVPAWLDRAVRRGLSQKPDDRYPDMGALLAELRRDPGRQRRRRLMTASLLVLPLAAVAGIWWPAADPCAAGQSEIEDVYGDPTKAKIRARFAETKARFADGAADGVVAQLDAYAERWAQAHRRACEATHIKHTQSEHRLDLRMTCLEDRRFALQATVTGLGEADAATVQRAAQAVASLPPIDECNDVERLEVSLALPEDPALAERVRQLRRRGAELDTALRLVGTPGDLDGYTSYFEEAEATAHAPLVAEAAFVLAMAHVTRGEAETAQAYLEDAAYWALAADHDRLLARVYTRLAHVTGILRSRYDEGLRWGRLAEGVVASLGKQSSEGTDHASVMCKLLADKGEPKAALPHCHWALDHTRARGEGNEWAVASSEEALAIAYYHQHDYANARRHFEAARDGFAATSGERHPISAQILNSLAAVCYAERGAKSCVDEFEGAAKASVAALGPDHPQVADVSNNLALMLVEVDRVAEARHYANEALRIRQERTDQEHPGIAASLRVLALADEQTGDPDEALNRLQQALPIAERTRGADHPDVLTLRADLARICTVLGRTDDAKGHYDAAMAIARRRDDRATLAELEAGRAEVDGGGTSTASASASASDPPSAPTSTPTDGDGGSATVSSVTPPTSPGDSDRSDRTSGDRPPRNSGG